MQIKSISIENFRSISAIALTDLSAGILIAGFNDSGKSNLLNAVRFCLYGRCEYTDKRGGGYARLVRHGQTTAHMQIRIIHGDSDIDVMCSITRRGQEFAATIHGTGELFADTRQSMWARLGIEADHAEMGAAMSAYLADGFDRIINAYLAETIPIIDVLTHSGSHNEWLTGWLKQHGFLAESYTPDLWRDIGQSIYGARTGVNQEIKQLGYEIELIGTVTAPLDASGNPIPLEKLPQCRAKLKSMEGLRSQFLVELGGCGNRRPAETIAADREKKQARLAERETAVQAVRENITVAERALQDAEMELRGLHTQDSRLRSRRLELESRANRFKNGTCDKCGSKLSKTKLGELLGDSANELMTNKTEQGQAAKQIEAAKITIAQIQDRLSTLRAEFGAADTERQRVATEHALLLRESPAGRTRDEVQSDLDDLDAKIATGRDIVTRLEKLANHAGMTQRLAERQAEADHMTYFCKALRDGELIARLSQGDRKTELLARINAELKPVDYQIDIRPDGKSLAVFMARSGGTFDPFADCSTGMQWLAQFALALGFSAGGPVILDNLDHLDGRNREHVRRRLRTVEDSVVLTMAWNGRDAAGAEIARAFAPARLVWLDGGRANVMEAAGLKPMKEAKT